MERKAIVSFGNLIKKKGDTKNEKNSPESNDAHIDYALFFISFKKYVMVQ